MLISSMFSRMSEETIINVKKLTYFLVLLPTTAVFFVPLVADYIGSANIAAFSPFLIFFVLIPILDEIFGLDTFNPDEKSSVGELDESKYYRYLSMLTLPWLLFIQFWSASYFMSADFSIIGSIGWIVSVGITAAVLGINLGHELIHKNERIENWVGGLLLGAVWYGGFKVEHVRGHHVNVSTPEDATSAKFNQNAYHFLPRAYWHNIRAAFALEAKRLKNKGHHWLNWRNELFWWYGFSIILTATFAFIWGAKGAIFFLGQAFVAFTVLELINYVEHYGLRRRKDENGRYERTKPEHSWNNSNYITNMMLFQLQRHSDHHANPRRRYQNLRHYDNVPQLPYGYPTMLLLPLVPPLWFKIMNPRVEEFYGDETFYKEEA